MTDFDLTVAFWLALAMAVGGTAAALFIAWREWRIDVEIVRRRRGIREAVERGLSHKPPARPPIEPSRNAFEFICDDEMEKQTTKAIDRAHSRRPRAYGQYQG